MHDNIEDFLSKLNCWDTFLFHGKITTTQKHFQVILNSDININSEMIMFSISTTQIQKKQEFIKNRWLDSDTIVIAEIWEIPFLNERSCFNCNGVTTYDKYSLFWHHLSWDLKYIWKIPSDIMTKILHWVKISELISNRDKKIIWVLS